MKRVSVALRIRTALAGFGYGYKSGAFTKQSGTIIAMIYLNKHRLESVIEVELGVGPLHLCLAIPPKWPSHLALSFITRDVPALRNSPVYERLGDIDAIEPELLDAEIIRLATWIDNALLDETKLTALVLDENSWVAHRSLATLRLRRWAGLDTSDDENCT